MNNSVFLLLGPEIGEKNNFLANIKKKIETETKNNYEIIKYYPSENLIDFTSAIINQPLFSERVIGIINNADEIKSKEECEKLINVIKSMPDFLTLIFLSEEMKIDSRIEKSVPDSNKKIFWELFEEQKKAWLIKYFKNAEKKIDEDSVNFLLEMVENNTNSLKNICEKIVIVFSDKNEIVIEDIENFIFHSKSENVFTLFEKIASHDLKSSLDILKTLLISGENNPIQILSGLLWQFRKLSVISQMIQQGKSFDNTCEKLFIKSKKTKLIYQKGIKLFSLGDIRRIIILLSDFDLSIKKSKTELHTLLLELFLYYCIKNLGKKYKINTIF